MALPTNKITKIKLPNNTEYEIIPKTLRDGTTTYKLSVPTLTTDDTVSVTSNTPIIYTALTTSVSSVTAATLNKLKIGDVLILTGSAIEYVVTSKTNTVVTLCGFNRRRFYDLSYTKSNNTWTLSSNTSVVCVVKFYADLEDPADVMSYSFDTGDIFTYSYSDDSGECADEYVVSKVNSDADIYWLTHVENNKIKEYRYYYQNGLWKYEYNEYPLGGSIEIDDLTSL